MDAGHAPVGTSSSAAAPEQAPDGQELTGEVAPHDSTLAVWGMPDAVAAGERFTVKVGAKSSVGCVLRGGRIEIRDAAAAAVASGCLGEAPWPGTGALFWAEIELRAPAVPGLLTLSAQFDAAEIDPPHRGASSHFSVAIVERPEHTMTVKVIAKENLAPVDEAHVRLGPHHATTDGAGLAEVKVSKGRYPLHVWKAGYEAPATAIDVTHDVFVTVELVTVLEQDPDAHWKG